MSSSGARHTAHIRLGAVGLLCVAVLGYTLPTKAQAAPLTPPACGLQVAGVKLKDHSLFYHAGFYYLISIRIVLPEPPNGRGEDALLVARSADRCTWEVLGTALTPARRAHQMRATSGLRMSCGAGRRGICTTRA